MAALRITQSAGIGGVNNVNDIKAVQTALNALLALISPTAPLVVDGKLGANPERSKTVAAITMFQRKVVGLVRPDGKIDVNGRTHRSINDKLNAAGSRSYRLPPVQSSPALTDADYTAAATALGCEVAAIKAVAEVESAGDAFFSNGQPKILFEAHIFSRLTKRAYDLSHPTLSSRSWNRALYAGGIAEYTRLEHALALDVSAALQSASWGRFQIMGFNYQACGYSLVENFVKDMFQSQAKQLDAFAAFLKSNDLDKHLKSKDWAAFAKGYNGPEYAANKYDVKMKDAYERYAKK